MNIVHWTSEQRQHGAVYLEGDRTEASSNGIKFDQQSHRKNRAVNAAQQISNDFGTLFAHPQVQNCLKLL